MTGATGLVGFEVLDALRAAGHEAVGTSRRGDPEAGIVPWTLGEPVPSGLDRPWDVIVHSAADVRWTMTEAEAQAANVATVAALAPLAGPRIITPDSWHRFFLPFARRHLTVRQNRLLDLLSHFEPYFALTTPLSPTHEVDDVLGCVEASARHWADRNPRLASLDPRPWKT